MTTQYPFAPSAEIFRTLISQGVSGISKNNAARTVIEGGKILSVPLEGGSACLKHRNPKFRSRQVAAGTPRDHKRHIWQITIFCLYISGDRENLS